MPDRRKGRIGKTVKIVVDGIETGHTAVVDVDGKLHVIPDAMVAEGGGHLPIVLSMLKDPAQNAGALEYLAELDGKEFATKLMKSVGAAKSSRSKFDKELKPTARKIALETWQRRPDLKANAVADIVMDRLQTEGYKPPSHRTILRWIPDLKP